MGVSTLHLLVALAILGCMATGTTAVCTQNSQCTGDKEYCKPGTGTRECDCLPGYIGGSGSCAVCTTPASCGGTFAVSCADPADPVSGTDKKCTCKAGYIFQANGACGQCTDADSCGGMTLGECTGSAGQKKCVCKSGYLPDFTLGCIECRAKGDCASKGDRTQCDTGSQMCVECTDKSHCATGKGDKTQCDTSSKTCVECTIDTHCAGKGDKTKCDASSNMCVECLSITDCASKTGKEQCDIADTKTCMAFSAKVKIGAKDVDSSVQVKGRSSVTLTCEAGPATGAPTYKWKDEAGASSTGASYMISGVSGKVGKKYTCEASKVLDTTGPIATTKAEVTLTDELKVVIKNKKDNKVVSGGTIQTKGLTGDLTLACKATPLVGTAEYKWTDDKGDQLGGDYTTTTNGEVKISNPGNKAGKLKCTATDSPTGGATKSTLVTLVKSGSANLQISYLMLGLVTLVSAVWSGRVC